MPPKRAKAAAKPAATRSAPKTRTTRSRTTAKESSVEETPDVKENVKIAKSGTKRTRNRTSGAEEDAATPGGQEESETTMTRTRRATVQRQSPENSREAEEPKTVQKALPRGRRPPRTIRKLVQSEANKAAIEGLKKRMEEDARRLQEGDVPAPEQPSTEAAVQVEAEKSVSTAAEVEAAPGLPPTNISPPTNRTRAAPRTLQRKAPGTIQRGAPNTAQKAAPGTIARPQSSVKVQSTPGVENSVLALANFRRRARQPSLLQMVRNPDLAQDLENDSTDFNTEFTLGASDDEDDFAPHDESTPLQVAKTQPLADQPSWSEAGTPAPAPAAATTTTAVENDTDSLYNATPMPSPHPKSSRKRKSDAMDEDESLPHSEIQIPRSQPSPSGHRSPTRLSRNLSVPSSPNPDDTIPATAPSRTVTPSPQKTQLSSTYASPLSSSILASPISPSDLPSQTAPPPRQASPSPTTTRRPAHNQTKPKATSGSQKSKVLTTATLRALLPKRRRQLVAADRERERERHEYDISSSSLSSSLEEGSSDNDTAAGRRRKAAAAKTRAKGALSPVVNKKGHKGTVVPAAKTGQIKKTYSRAITVASDTHSSSLSSSDKENNAEGRRSGSGSASDNILARGESSELSELESAAADAMSSTPPDTSIETIKGVGGRDVSKELRERKRFFEEVDDWEMEFESMSGGGVGSSPAWR